MVSLLQSSAAFIQFSPTVINRLPYFLPDLNSPTVSPLWDAVITEIWHLTKSC